MRSWSAHRANTQLARTMPEWLGICLYADVRPVEGRHEMSEPLEGGCFCKAVRYRLTSAPMFVHCCHCLNCQSQTGSAFVINAMIETDRIELLQGLPVVDRARIRRRTTPRRLPLSRLPRRDLERLWARTGGAFRPESAPSTDPTALSPDVHIFTRSKQPWVGLPDDTPVFEVFYDVKELWPAASLERRRAAPASRSAGMRISIRVAIALSLVVFTSVAADVAPSGATFEWKQSTPEAQGVDSAMLLRSLRRIRDEDLDIRSLILIRNDRVILELYVHPYDRDTVHNVKSVSKSILSALVGIAPARGSSREHRPDPSVNSFHGTSRRRQGPAQRDHALEPADDDVRARSRRERPEDAGGVCQRQLDPHDLPGEHGDGAWRTLRLQHAVDPHHGGHPHRASGKSMLEFANEQLFGPLGFGALEWSRGPQGYYFGGAELFLRPRDMAKFGLLYHHGGQWAGTQLVPAEWVAESTRNQLAEDSSVQYGYWWWIDPSGFGFKAQGWGGQGISVLENLRMVRRL